MIDVRIKGIAKTQQRLRAVNKTAPEAIIVGMMALGERIMSDAVARCPVDTGRLRQSAYVAPPQVTGERDSVELGFGTGYAVDVHERTEVRHESGEAKFLEKAVMKKGVGQLHFIADQAEAYIARGASSPSTKFKTSTSKS